VAYGLIMFLTGGLFAWRINAPAAPAVG